MTDSYADDKQRYRLDSRIATGGMGEVWRATDTALDRVVAVKLLKAEYADDATFRSRFETEARHAAALHHPGVAGVFDVGESAARDGSGVPRPYLVMELVDGQPLSALLQGGRELDTDAVRDLMAQTGDALGAAHRAGIVHRDVKPANLMVTPDGTVKVTDFGIARAAEGVGLTRTGAVMGTPQYLSPEQAEGKPATVRSDVYALGVVAFECLAGRRPFEAESPVATALAHLREPVPDLPADVPADLAAVVKRSLSKDPADRYDDGSAFARALRDPAAGAAGAADAGTEDRTQVMGAAPLAAAGAAYVEPDPTPAEAMEEPVTTSTTVTQAPGEPEDPKRSNQGLVIAAVVLLVALAIVVTLLVTGGDDEEAPVADDPTSAPSEPTPSETESEEPTPEPTQEETTSEAPAEVAIDSSDYEGGQIDQVESDLRNLGLDVTRNEIDNDGSFDEGVVESVNPDGTLAEGDRVTVNYYGAPPAEPDPAEPTESDSPSGGQVPDTPVLPGDDG